MKEIIIHFEGAEYEIEVEADVKNQEFSFGYFEGYGRHSDFETVVENVKIESCKRNDYNEDGSDDGSEPVIIEDTDFLFDAVETYVIEHSEQFIEEYYEH